VGVDREIIGGARFPSLYRHGGCSIFDIARDIVLDDSGRPNMLPELRLIGQAFRLRPIGLVFASGADRLPFSLRGAVVARKGFDDDVHQGSPNPLLKLLKFTGMVCVLHPT
jgi:hypothetical protein